jgi:DNA-binding winged helix-turn-helix (wHTH) protein
MTRDVNRLYEFGAFRVDTAERVLFREGEPIFLPPKVYDTLLILVSNAGHTLEKEYLLRELWPDTFVEEGNLAQNISVLRKALSNGGDERYIVTVPRRGYRFVAPVSEVKETEIERVDAAKAPETEIAGPIQSKPVERFQPAAELSAAPVRLGRATPIMLYAAIGLLALTAVLVIRVAGWAAARRRHAYR